MEKRTKIAKNTLEKRTKIAKNTLEKRTKYLIDEIFKLIASELNAKNKRFILKNLNENFKFNRYEDSFLWLKNAGVAIPTYNVEEPKVPFILNDALGSFLFASLFEEVCAKRNAPFASLSVVKNVCIHRKID